LIIHLSQEKYDRLVKGQEERHECQPVNYHILEHDQGHCDDCDNFCQTSDANNITELELVKLCLREGRDSVTALADMRNQAPASIIEVRIEQ